MQVAAQLLPFVVFAAFVAVGVLLIRRRKVAAREDGEANRWSPINELKFVGGMLLFIVVGVLLLLVLGRVR